MLTFMLDQQQEDLTKSLKKKKPSDSFFGREISWFTICWIIVSVDSEDIHDTTPSQ